ncbi:MAG: lytic transglycosylase domain-containing protein [Pseudomonadota bacterium]|nr:lytic transglycosylase domain-containing protein [Pseudomonadota bacterium]
MRRSLATTLLLVLPGLWPGLAPAASQPAPVTAPASASASAPAPHMRSGLEIYSRFRDGLADPDCDAASSSERWRKHFAAAPQRMARHDDDALALFGYVVDALHESSLPTEYALIPFVESRYRPDARSKGGPAGMWQMIRLTARKYKIPMRAGFDGRLSPVEATRAAVRYLKTLHGMFAGDWRLAAMAYNAGEYRVFGALRRSGQVARSADPEKLTSLSGITRAYVRKLHALSCLLEGSQEHAEWMQSIDREVPVLEMAELPAGTRSLDAWSRATGRDPALVRRLNPAFADGRVQRDHGVQRVLAPRAAPRAVAASTLAP